MKIYLQSDIRVSAAICVWSSSIWPAFSWPVEIGGIKELPIIWTSLMEAGGWGGNFKGAGEISLWLYWFLGWVLVPAIGDGEGELKALEGKGDERIDGGREPGLEWGSPPAVGVLLVYIERWREQ